MFLCAMKPKFSISECKGRIFYWFCNGMGVILTLFCIGIVESGGGEWRQDGWAEEEEGRVGWADGLGGEWGGGENKSGGRTVSFIYNNVYEMAYSVLYA